MECTVRYSKGFFLLVSISGVHNLFQTIIAEKNRNDSVKQLVNKLKETYDFITDVKRLPDLRDTQTDTLSQLVRQTIECGYFIQEYSRTSIG